MRNIQLETILSNVSAYYGFDQNELKVNSRKNDVALARHVYCYLSCKLTKNPYNTIGIVINRNHATVIHAQRKISGMKDVYPKLKNDLTAIEKELNDNRFDIIVTNVNLLEMAKRQSLAFK